MKYTVVYEDSKFNRHSIDILADNYTDAYIKVCFLYNDITIISVDEKGGDTNDH